MELLRRTLLYPMHETLMSDQIRPLRVSVATVLANERLRPQVTGLVILQIVIRHEASIALVAVIAKVALVHSSLMSAQGNLVDRGEVAQLAQVLDATVEVHVAGHLRGTLEGLFANLALVGPLIAVLHHVPFVVPVPLEIHVAHRARKLPRLLLNLRPLLPRSRALRAVQGLNRLLLGTSRVIVLFYDVKLFLLHVYLLFWRREWQLYSNEFHTSDDVEFRICVHTYDPQNSAINNVSVQHVIPTHAARSNVCPAVGCFFIGINGRISLGPFLLSREDAEIEGWHDLSDETEACVN